MPLTGTLRSWNDDRGFGFIAPTHGGPEVFAHISAFPRDGSRPTVGERLSYELGHGRDGKAQAVNIARAAIGRVPTPRATKNNGSTRHARWPGAVLALSLIVVVGAYGYNRYKGSERRLALENMPAVASSAELEKSSGIPARCDGRTHCSEMTSCAEAKWFINNCPGTRMDGNHDGVPCEKQWCTGPFFR